MERRYWTFRGIDVDVGRSGMTGMGMRNLKIRMRSVRFTPRG